MITAECWERTVGLEAPGMRGSGFTVTLHGRQWLITAAHVVAGADAKDIQLTGLHLNKVQLEPVPGVLPGADIAIFSLSGDLTPDLNLTPGIDGIIWSQDAYFLGFPFGIGFNSGASSLPFVKKAIVSGLYNAANGVGLVLLDGINNPGFSGGPVVFCKSGTRSWSVAGIVSGYLPDAVDVVGGAGGTVSTNTGIIVAHQIRHAVDAIDLFVGAAATTLSHVPGLKLPSP